MPQATEMKPAKPPRKTFVEWVSEAAENKKLISRLITIIIFGIAIYEELARGQISDNWTELTKWCLLYYFGRATAQKIAEVMAARK